MDMEARGAVSLYSWYQQVKKKDLGVTRRDWLQYLRDEAKHKCQNKNKATDSRHPQEDISQRERKITEEQIKREKNVKDGVAQTKFDSLQTKADIIPSTGGAHSKNDFENNPALQDDSGVRKTSPMNKEYGLEAKREGMVEGNIKPIAPSPQTPVQESKSFSMFLDTSFATPTLELLEGGTRTPDLSHASTLFSPTVPLADIVSTGTSAVNTTRELAASLGGSLDGSVGSWTSALATPSGAAETGDTRRQSTPSTLERLTLHPKQRFRQNVLARSLFSPHTPRANSSSTSDEWSPGLGIIKCHSPLPVFSNKLPSAVSKRARTGSENNEQILEYGTQGFTINLHGNKESAKKEEEEDSKKVDYPKIRDGKSTRLGSVEDVCPQNVICDQLDVWCLERPDKTSTPVFPQARTSLFAQHLVHSIDSPLSQDRTDVVQVTRRDFTMNSAQDAEMMQTKKNVDLKDHIGIANMDTLPQSDASEDSYELSQNPFDLICSPVKKVKPKNSAQVGDNHVDIEKTVDMKDMNAVDDRNGKVVDGETHSHDTENMDKVTDNVDDSDSENADHVQKTNKFSRRKLPPENSIHERNLTPLSSKIRGESAGKDKLVDIPKGRLISKYENIDSNHYTSAIKITPEKSQMGGKSHISPPPHPAPLFKRVTSCENINSDQECVKTEIFKTTEKISTRLSEPSQTKSILNKLSLHKKKRLSGKFLYPTKSEEGYEKLNMKYTEVIGQIKNNESSVLVPEVSDAKLSTSKLTNIHTIANRQQNFLSLTNLEKDIRFETSAIPPKSETTVSHNEKDEKFSSASDQEVPLNFNKVCNVDRLPDRCRTPPVASLSAKSEAESTKAGSVMKSNRSSLYGSCDRIGNDEMITGDGNERNNNPDINYMTRNFEQDHSKIVSGYKHSSVPQNRLSANVTRSFEDGHKKEASSEILNCELRVVPEKSPTKEEVLPISSLSCVHHCKTEHLASSQILVCDGASQMMNDSLNDIDFSEIDVNVCIPVKDDKNTEKWKSGVRQLTQETHHGKRNEIVCDPDDGYVKNDGCIDGASHENYFCGFLTGMGKQTKVSKDALKHGKKFLEEPSFSKQTIAQHPLKGDESDDQENIIPETHLKINIKDKNNPSLMSACSRESSSGICGFSTASGLKVTVNEASLKRAKRLWEEEDSLVSCNPDDSKVEMTDKTRYLSRDISKRDSQNELDERRQKSQFIGFKTGKGTAVQVGEASLRKAHEMWHDETRGHIVSDVSKGKTNNIQNSHKSSSHVDLEMHSVSASVRQHSCTGATFGKVTGNNGFVMASGAEVRISKEALRKAQLLWEENNMVADAEQENNGRHLQDLPKPEELAKKCLGIGSERKVSHSLEEVSPVSEGSVKKVGVIASPTFLEFNQSGFQRAQDMNRVENTGGPPGSNRVPTETLERNIKRNVETEHTVDNIVPNNDQYNTVSIIQRDIDRNNLEVNSEENSKQLKGESFSGFQTAKGKIVTVNKAAVMRARKLWEESNNSEEENRLILDSKRMSSLTKGSAFEQPVGSPSSVPGAKESKRSVSSLHAETPQDLRLSTTESSFTKAKDAFDGRPKMPGGKGRNISLSRARMVDREQRDIGEPSLPLTTTNVLSDDKDKCGAFPSFTTARGDQVFVSKEAICKAKSVFDEDLPESDNREKINVNTLIPVMGHRVVQGEKFQGFSTAHGRKVHISQDALERAQKLLNEETSDENEMMIQQEKQASYEDANFQSRTVYAGGTNGLKALSTNKVVDSNNICKGTETSGYGSIIGSPMEHPKDKSLEESSTGVPSFINTGNRAGGELQAGEIFTEDVVQVTTKEMRDLDPSSCLLTDDINKGDTIIKTTRGMRQVVSAKNKLNASEVEPKTQSLGETDDVSKKDAQFISRDSLKGRSYNKDISTDEDGEPSSFSSKSKGANCAGKSILVSEAVEPLEIVSKCATLKEETLSDEYRSPSPILGSQRNFVSKVHGDSVHVMPLQQHINMKRTQHDFDTVHSENAELLAFINSDCDSSFSKPVRKKMKYSDDHVNFKHGLNAINLNKDDLNTLSSETHSQPNFKTPKIYASSPMRASSLPNSLKVKDSLKDEGNTRLKRTHSTDTQEITEITEAFLKDDPWESEAAPKGQAAQGKRSQGSSEEREDESSVDSSKRQRMNADVDMRENTGAQAVQGDWEMMRLKQVKEIQYKEKLSVQPIKGSLYKMRTEEEKERRKLKSFGTLKVFHGGRREINEVNAKNSVRYRFPMKDERCGSVNCVDGCYVVPGADGYIGVEEIKQAFLAMPGVHPGLLPPAWITNHYRWIVWKLAALERRLLNCEVLTLEGVVARLKYRYDREIDRAQRPILRKITEQDDIPQKTMILCVASIMNADQGAAKVPCVEIKAQSPNCQASKLELTDGWYSIGAVVDSAMTQLIHDGKVEVGTKLVIHGAELTGSSAACHPLEAPPTLCLRLHTNMTRRARWWARLGLLPQKGPLPASIGATLSDGGVVGQMTVMLARVYPMVYFERSNGRAVFRGEKAHLRLLRETQQQKETYMHQVISEVEKEFSEEKVESSEDSGDQLPMTGEEIRNLTMGRDIAQLMDKTLDPCSLEGLLTPQQVELARTWRQRQAEEKRRKINAEVHRRLAKKQISYEATPLLKVRIVDSDGAGAMVTIWRPSEDHRQAFTEDAYFVVHYLMAGGYRNGSLQFKATRKTRWEQIKECPAINSVEFARFVTPLCLMSSGELQPLWKEVDIVGVVLRVGQLDRGSQIVHIVDHHVNILALMVWGGLRDCGIEDSVVIGSVISVLNGSWRGHRGGRFSCVHLTELTTITISPRSPHLQEASTHLKESIKNMKTLLHEGDMKLDGQFDSRAYPTEPSSSTDVQYVVGKSVQKQVDELESRYGVTKESKVTKTDSETDYSSPQDVEREIDVNPKLIRLEQRTREVRSKLKILGQYGTPSAVRAIQSPATAGARKPFRIPFKQLQKSDSVRDTSA